MTANWTLLDQELRIWEDQGLRLPLWWRDDDAVEPCAQLDRLIALSEQLDLPVYLAVIPSLATPALADRLAQTRFRPVVHGWAHRSHAPASEKKAEFGAHRATADMLADARQGLDLLNTLFARQVDPIFVPPWNRIAPDVATGLADTGYSAVSTFTPRQAVFAAPGLEQINTHLDPIHWKGDRSLVPAQQLIDQVTGDLYARRTGAADNCEPYGILTHHLVHDDAIWTFTHALISRLLDGPATAWAYQPRKTT